MSRRVTRAPGSQARKVDTAVNSLRPLKRSVSLPALVALLAAAGLLGCGQKGPLYLPAPQARKVPATANPTAAPQTQGSQTSGATQSNGSTQSKDTGQPNATPQPGTPPQPGSTQPGSSGAPNGTPLPRIEQPHNPTVPPDGDNSAAPPNTPAAPAAAAPPA